jgi:hypothetical protein
MSGFDIIVEVARNSSDTVGTDRLGPGFGIFRFRKQEEA